MHTPTQGSDKPVIAKADAPSVPVVDGIYCRECGMQLSNGFSWQGYCVVCAEPLLNPDYAGCAEFALLSLMTPDTHKFGIAVALPLNQAEQSALERLQLRDWIRLIDISPATHGSGQILRVFRVMPDAVAWFESKRAQGWPYG